MSLETLEDLLIDNLRDLHNAENQQVKSLPKMARAASRPELKRAIEEHLGQTRGQIERLEQIFTGLGKSPRGKKCAAMEGLVEEGAEVLEESEDDAVKDAGIIVALQKAEHYEIAAYGSVRTFADQLGMRKAAQLLDRSLAEEKKADEKLNKLAMRGGVNVKAKQGESGSKGRGSTQKSSGAKRGSVSRSRAGKTSASRSGSSSRSASSSKSAGKSLSGSRSTSAKSSASRSGSGAKSSRSLGGASSRSTGSGTSSARGSKSRSSSGGTKSSSRGVSASTRTAPRSSGSSLAKSSASPSSGSAISDVTKDHDFIRRWVEARGGKPACVRGTGDPGDVGLLRIDFPGFSGGETLQEISWDEFFEKFDEENLAFLYQDRTADGKQSRFMKLISKESLGR